MSYTLLAAVFAMAQGVSKSGRATCEAGPVIGRSPFDVTQVSNLEMISVTCRIPARRLPKSGVQQGLRIDAKVYELSGDSVRKLVPSTNNLSGNGGDSNFESVNFYVDIPIDASERDAAIRAYWSEVARSAASSQDQKERQKAQLVQKIMPQAFVPYFRQHRTGRFQVDCRVLDGGKIAAVGRADLEVVFKGNFFDQPQFHARQ